MLPFQYLNTYSVLNFGPCFLSCMLRFEHLWYSSNSILAREHHLWPPSLLFRAIYVLHAEGPAFTYRPFVIASTLALVASVSPGQGLAPNKE